MIATQTTIGEYLIARLYKHGIRHIFGIPGDYVLGFYNQLEQSQIKVVNTSDEQGAGFAADAYARIRGLGAVCITYGVGGLKIANTTAQAYAEESPVVVISGAPGIQEQQGNPLLHHKVKSFDTQQKVFDELTVASTVLDNPETACYEIDRVLSAAICYRRPVYIELPRDMTFKPVTPPAVDVLLPKTDKKAFAEALQEATQKINAARQPVILTGVEVLRYGQQKYLLQFAEQTHIPVASTILSKSAFGERHPLYIGVYEGGMSQEYVRRYVEESDCVIMLGVFLTDLNLGIFTANLDQGKSIYSTSEKTSIGYHTYPGVYVNGFLKELLKAGVQPRQEFQAPPPTVPLAFQAQPEKPLTIVRVFQQLNALLNDNTFVISDTGDALFAAADIAIPRATEFMASAYYASLGFSVPASVGVQMAQPGLRPLVIVGDGAFQMTGMELSTVARYKLNPIVIVLNNFGYGTERPMLDGAFNDVYGWKHSNIPQVLRTGKGFEVHTEAEFAQALQEAFDYTKAFSIIDVHLDPHDFSQGLQRLTSALKTRVK